MLQEALYLHRNEYYFEHSPSVSALLKGPIPTEFISTYATRDHLETVIKEIASALQVDPGLVTLYHGAEDALFKILSWAASQRMKVHTTSLGWAEYMRMMQGLELKVQQTQLLSLTTEYQHPTEAFEQTLASESSRALVLLASPNNPTGHDVPIETLLHLSERFPEKTFLIDRVYTEFSSETFAALSQRSNVIVLGSFSKFFGLPGLRVGFAIGRVPAVQTMALGPSPWALKIARAALQERHFYAAHWAQMKITSERLQTLKSTAGVFLKTAAPFVLFRCNATITEQKVRKAQSDADLVGKIIATSQTLHVRWSLGSPLAYQRIANCVSNLESSQ